MESLCRKIVKFIPLYLRKRLPKDRAVIQISQQDSLRFNRIYRDKDKPASVLSFYYGPDYGEILICPEIIRKEANSQNHSYEYQVTWMILHGMIHLAGIHHEKSKKKVKLFERIEKSVLCKLF